MRFSSAASDALRRQRAKGRLYVVLQAGTWLLLLTLQVLFSLAFSHKKRSPDEIVRAVAVITSVIAIGWLISHFGRVVIRRCGWKELGWRALVPRILGLASIEAAVWTALGFAATCWIAQKPTPTDMSLSAVIAVSWINGLIVYTGWLCIYFFYHLFDRYNRLEIEKLRLAAEVKEAELRALKSQVNPHFMFNALNSVRALIDEDPPKARLAVTQLANLLRYSLQSAQAETVSFEDELRVVSDYLALEQVRHEERLRLRLDIAPETLRLAVPPLLLQTLVENAVKYGISPRPDGGEVTIVARCEDGELRLRVTNPGDLNTTPAAPNGTKSTGLGLKNAAERLRLFFGDRATLRVRAESPTSVVAEVSVPIQLSRG